MFTTQVLQILAMSQNITGPPKDVFFAISKEFFAPKQNKIMDQLPTKYWLWGEFFSEIKTNMQINI